MKTLINNPVRTINPVFYPVWTSKKTNNILKGGRSSTKSSVISTKLVAKKMKYPESNAIAFRQVANTLNKSVYSQITWALHEAGVADQFIFKKNPLEIIHKKWGTGFYFSGADDPEKLKSLKIPIGFVSDLWFEEMDSFSGEEAIDKIQDTFIRNDLPYGLNVTTWGSYNPPRNPYLWINDYIEKHRNDDDFLIHHSTYLDDKLGYNSEQILRKIEKYKENDFDYYRWMYLGEVIGMGTNVYNAELFQELDELPSGEYVVGLYYGIDSGHQVSATSCVCVGYTNKRNVVLLDMYYYSPAGKSIKKAPSELSKELNDFIKRTSMEWKAPIVFRVIDSAEGALRNQYYLDFKIRLEPVNKLKNVTMIDFVQDLLAQGRFYYLKKKSTEIFVDEHRKYMWDEKTLNSDDPKVLKVDDHSVDAFKYLVITAAKKWNLKV
ncbi:terminase [Floricoccus tropicus]|uniref:Terminase n=1 Tax=Floricoccus tropicus TaxID=1859473 RepID=A0A1E8GMS5_9LACT|nr:PBSX family phage terminase large subunit [Floricoccus tropicus]OFI48828.1 terminase [Floricoccus tropicus]